MHGGGKACKVAACPVPCSETAPRPGAPACSCCSKKRCFVPSVPCFGFEQDLASCDLLGDLPADCIKVPQNQNTLHAATHAQEAGGAGVLGSGPHGVRGAEARSRDDPCGAPAEAGGVAKGIQGLHVQPGHSPWGHPLLPNVPSAPDHVPAAGPALGRAFPKRRANSWPQGPWA